MIQNNRPEYLYLHVPFCRTICSYCDFCHAVYTEQMAEQWLDALSEEIRQKEINPQLKTIYIGGGTPTSLSCMQLERLLTLLDPYRQQVIEYTVEINPETLDETKAEILQKHGVNRASIGFQTSSPTLLKMMGRHHDLPMMHRTIDMLRSKGISNLSLDLMYSLPQQTMKDLQTSLQDALSMQPDHLSLYSLTIEENTVFGKHGYQHLSDDEEADMYEWICRVLPSYGFHQYEISNFAKGDHESLHNKAYWNYRDFYGISMGASGKEGLCRYEHTRSFQTYFKNPCAVETIPLTKKDAMFEMVMMGLRLKQGMDLSLFQETFQMSFLLVFESQVQQLIQKGLLEIEPEHVKATDRGYEILNSVLVDLMDDENNGCKNS